MKIKKEKTATELLEEIRILLRKIDRERDRKSS